MCLIFQTNFFFFLKKGEVTFQSETKKKTWQITATMDFVSNLRKILSKENGKLSLVYLLDNLLICAIVSGQCKVMGHKRQKILTTHNCISKQIVKLNL